MTKSYFREKIGVKLNNSHIYFSEPKKVFLFQLILIADKKCLHQQEAAKQIKLILYSSTKIINCIRALSVSFDHRLTNVPVIGSEPRICTDFLGADLPAFVGLSA